MILQYVSFIPSELSAEGWQSTVEAILGEDGYGFDLQISTDEHRRVLVEARFDHAPYSVDDATVRAAFTRYGVSLGGPPRVLHPNGEAWYHGQSEPVVNPADALVVYNKLAEIAAGAVLDDSQVDLVNALLRTAFTVTLDDNLDIGVEFADGYNPDTVLNVARAIVARDRTPETVGSLFDGYPNGDTFIDEAGRIQVLVSKRYNEITRNKVTTYQGQVRFDNTDGFVTLIDRATPAAAMDGWSHETYGNGCGCPMSYGDSQETE